MAADAASAIYVDRCSARIEELIEARIRVGIHFRTADVHGATLGSKAAQYMRSTTSSRSAEHELRGPPRGASHAGRIRR